MAAHETHHDPIGHTSADDQYLETPAGGGYEHTDASVRLIVRFMLWLGVAAVIIHVGLALLFELFVTQRVERTEPRFPLAAQEGQRLPPEPRLQQFPREDILRFRTGEDETLRTYGWIDRDAGTVRMPIQDAMRLMLERKTLASRPPPQGNEPQMVPSDASGGRTLVRR